MGCGLRHGLPAVVLLATWWGARASDPQPEYHKLEQDVKSTTCENEGMLDILEFIECKRAAEALGLHYQFFQVVSANTISPGCWHSREMSRLSLTLPCDNTSVCVFERRPQNTQALNASESDKDRRLQGGAGAGGGGAGMAGGWNISSSKYICAAAVAPGEESDAPTLRKDHSTIAAVAGLCVVTCAALVTCCARGGRRVDIAHSLLRFLRRSLCRSCKSGHEPRQAEMEAAACVLAERSQRLTHAVMSFFVLAHTVESLGSAAADSAPCASGSGKAGFAGVCLHSAGSAMLCLLSRLLLASQAWLKLPGKFSMTCMLAAELSLRLSLVGLTAEAALLSPFRFQQDLVWRVLLGLCSSPILGIAGNIVYSIAMITCFAVQVPVESVAYFSEQRAGIYLAGGCVSFLPGEEMRALAAFFANLNQESSGGLVSSLGLVEDRAVELLDSMPSFLQSAADNMTSLRAFMLTELLSLCIAAVVILVVRSFMSEDVRNLVRLDDAKNNSKAVSSILCRLCDSVTCLDANLKLSSPSKQLASLLHANVACSCQIGDDFLKHVVEEDHEQVKSTLLAEDVMESNAHLSENVCIRLRDAFGIKLQCQMLYASFRDMHGTRSFVVGINEIGERTPVHHADVSGEIASGLKSSSLRSALVREHPDEASQHRVAEAASEASDNSSDGFSAHSENTVQALSRCVHFHTFGGEIIHKTTGFSRLLPKPSGKGKAPNIEKFWEKPDLFTSWLENVIYEISKGETETPCFRTYGPEQGRLRRDKKTGLSQQNSFSLEVCFPPLLVDPPEYCVSARILSMKCSRVAKGLGAFPEHQEASAHRGGSPEIASGRELSASYGSAMVMPVAPPAASHEPLATNIGHAALRRPCSL